ncbi:hypothetical protein ES288_D05G055400v1 [Gossypium darwinii]|uniref:Defective in cullin neddylation protein n=1 Tax=Gossypium darwinii TaxID=34276 RepID=A0A5D2CG10_GOSDA|nr:hypothetical protein ES288_D05G055400v1 [Gossypium darwinii]
MLVGYSNVSSKAKIKGLEKIDRLFNTYANSSFGMIDPEGIEALCSDLGVDYTDVRILMLAWKLKAEKQGYFTQDEWQTGLKALGVDSLSKLKKALSDLEKEVQNDYKVINSDQWINFLRFCKEISFPDLENYDAIQAWPLILDNYVEWMREKHS